MAIRATRRAVLGALLVLAAVMLSSCAAPHYWWTYQNDAARSGYVRGGIGRSPLVRWNATPGGGNAELTPPVFGAIGDTFRVFIGTGYGDRTLYALHPQTGVQLWTFTAPPNNGFAGAPAAVNGVVFAATMGSPNAAALYALDQATGSVVWSAPLPSTGSRASVLVAGTQVLVNTDAHQLYSFDANTGTMQWPAPAQTSPGTASQDSSPATWLDKVYVGSGDTLYAFELPTGALSWTYQLPPPTPGAPPPVIGRSSPAVALGGAIPLVLISATDMKVHAVNAVTGAFAWSYTSNCSLADTSLAVAEGRVFTRNLAGAVALDASTGALLWTHAIGLPTKTPAVGGRTVYYSDGSSVFGLDTATGTPTWKAPVPGGNSAGADMAIALEILIVPNRGHVYAFK